MNLTMQRASSSVEDLIEAHTRGAASALIDSLPNDDVPYAPRVNRAQLRYTYRGLMEGAVRKRVYTRRAV